MHAHARTSRDENSGRLLGKSLGIYTFIGLIITSYLCLQKLRFCLGNVLENGFLTSKIDLINFLMKIIFWEFVFKTCFFRTNLLCFQGFFCFFFFVLVRVCWETIENMGNIFGNVYIVYKYTIPSFQNWVKNLFLKTSETCFEELFSKTIFWNSAK